MYALRGQRPAAQNHRGHRVTLTSASRPLGVQAGGEHLPSQSLPLPVYVVKKKVQRTSPGTPLKFAIN